MAAYTGKVSDPPRPGIGSAAIGCCATTCCGCCCPASAVDPKAAQSQVRAEAPELIIDGEEFLLAATTFAQERVYFTSLRILVRDRQSVFGDIVSWKVVPYAAVQAFSVETTGSRGADLEFVFWASGVGAGEFSSSGMPSPGFAIPVKAGRGIDTFALQRLLSQSVLDPTGLPVAAAPRPQGMGDAAGGVSELMDLLCGDVANVDLKRIQALLRADPPILLADEAVDVAFRCGRGAACFTSRRMVLIETEWIADGRVSYMSLPWGSVAAFAVLSPCMLLDRACEIQVWSTVEHVDDNAISLDLRDASADVLAIQRYLADKVLGQDAAPPSAPAAPSPSQEDAGGSWQAWLAGDSRQVDVAEAERRFRHVLQGCEACDMAFKTAHDVILFTSKRLVKIDVQGLFAKRVEYKSFPWSCIQAFALESPGGFLDLDSQLMIWTGVFHSFYTKALSDNEVEHIAAPGESFFSVDLQKDKVDLPAIGQYLASRCAASGSQCSTCPVLPPTEPSVEVGEQSGMQKLLAWLGDDFRQCDPAQLDAELHGDCRMLACDEKVRMGFVCGHSTLILTTHRAMQIDKGFSGARVLCLSLPWARIKGWEVEAAGAWDLDAKMLLCIKSPWYNREVGNGLEVNFRKGRADVVAIDRLVASQVLGAASACCSSAPPGRVPDAEDWAVDSFLSWLGDADRRISREEAAARLTSDPDLLQVDEDIDLALKHGHGMVVLTSQRLLKVERAGRKVGYSSLPYRAARCLEVIGALRHPFDKDCQMALLSDVGAVNFEVKSRCPGDIASTYALCNRKVVLGPAGSSGQPQQHQLSDPPDKTHVKLDSDAPERPLRAARPDRGASDCCRRLAHLFGPPPPFA